MIERAVILAVGTPTAQSQLTYNRPFVMLPALGKPLGVRVMDRLRRIGVTRFTVVVGVDEGALAAYLNKHWYPDVQVDFVLRSGNESLMTILGDIAREHHHPFILTSSYSFAHAQLALNMVKNFEKEALNGLLLSAAATTLSNMNPTAYDYALMDGDRVTAITHERPQTAPAIFLGEMAICGPNFIEFLAAQPHIPFTNQLIDIFRAYLLQGGDVCLAEAAWLLPVKADFDLLTLNRHLLEEDQDAHILSEIHSSVRVVSPVRVDPSVSIGQGATIGPYVYLESNSSVGRGATLSNTIVLQNAVISAGEIVTDTIVSSRFRIHS